MELKDYEYVIQDVPVLSICDEFGTPLYVYDTAVIERQYKRLTSAFAAVPLRIKYACKALNNLSILKFMRSIGAGLDAVSIEEVELGLMAGFDPKEILFTPNSVSFEEIKQGVNLGVMINIDNIAILEQFGHEYGNSIPCCIRINPHIIAGGNANIQVGHIDSKFGISYQQIKHILRVVRSYHIKVTGLHMHSGSDILDANVFLQGAEVLFDLAEHFPDLEFMDFGSGFKVAYKEEDIATDIEELGRVMGQAFMEFCERYGRKLELWFEPGKFLVSEAGYFFVRVNTIKYTTTGIFVGVNSGQNHLIRPMYYNAYHKIINVSNPKGLPKIYNVVGYICETDTFGYDRKINEVREGDILCFKNAGAYGFTMSSNYNARLRPAEVLVHKGKSFLIRKRESLSDIVANQIVIEF
ncbi:MAG: diaminopimelate decarboxylase [Bacteroidia bacterium]|nr:diaminopimelate decarboxylase [Bacteroidia bacterium]MDW8347483.1 diaminopimelate decarboxylase [Bacteroidia bacterium]